MPSLSSRNKSRVPTKRSDRSRRESRTLKEATYEGVTTKDLQEIIIALEDIVDTMDSEGISELSLQSTTHGLYGPYVAFSSTGFLSLIDPFGRDDEEYESKSMTTKLESKNVRNSIKSVFSRES